MILLKKITLTRAVISLAFIFVSLTSAFAQVTLDNSFGNWGIVKTTTATSSEIIVTAIQPDGKIIAAGYLLTGSNYHFMVARYNSDGTIDSSFGTGGLVSTNIGFSSMPYSIALQADGKIIVAGAIRANNIPPFEYHSAMVRYNSDGSMDNNFGAGGIVITMANPSEDGIYSIALQPDGKIVAGGSAWNQCLLMRYNSDGTLDNGFGTAGIVTTTIEAGEWESSIYTLILQPDGKIITSGVSGDITNSKFAIARYNTNGTLDIGFGSGGTLTTEINAFFYDIAASVALLPNGKIIAAGYSDSNIALAKYNSDGTLDTGFGTGGIVTSNSYPAVTQNCLVLQPDGKIIVCGSKNNGGYDFSLTRFNFDGSPDSSFGANGNISTDIGSTSDYAQCISQQPDGKIVVGGSSRDSTPSSPARFTLIRFTSDITGINNIYSFSPYWIIFPNPANNHFSIVLGSNNKKVEVTITDITGKIIYSTTESETQKLEVNTKDFAEGVYIVQIHAADFIETKKIIVTK